MIIVLLCHGAGLWMLPIPARPLRKKSKPVVCSLYWPAFCCYDKDLPSLVHKEKRVILSHGFRPSWSLWWRLVERRCTMAGVGDWGGRSHVVEQNSSCPDQNVKAKRMLSYYGFRRQTLKDLETSHLRRAIPFHYTATLTPELLGGSIQYSHYSPFGRLSLLMVRTVGWGLTTGV